MPDVEGIPFDAPLYHGSKDRGSTFLRCRAINLKFSVGNEVSHLLPKGLVPSANPAISHCWRRELSLKHSGVMLGVLFRNSS
ncbi:hypothetical protein AB7M16_005010 [Bradyrhizobium sp. USDA 372]